MDIKILKFPIDFFLEFVIIYTNEDWA